MTTTQTAMASQGRSATSATVSSTAAHHGSARAGAPEAGDSVGDAVGGAAVAAGADPARWRFSGGMAHLLSAVRGARDGARGFLHWTTPTVATAGQEPVGGRSKSGRRHP
jgi:hypothetical protein